ncbi:MAG: bifunctional DNA primase/polymerase [Pyrinomonadaceae bacterium]|nr:bifunctional DNA primase/polymerase [Pyrinomonadaceae bacterium]
MNIDLNEAQRLVAGGLSLVAIKTGSKSPAIDWKPFQQRRPTAEELSDWTRRFPGLGIICGEVSGNLEVLDLEAAAPLEEFRQLVEMRAPGLIARLPRVRTPTDGRHIPYRCAVIEGNQKLAADSDGKTLIETRGEGGQVLSPLCLPETHPSGKPYKLLSGDLASIPVITPEEREILFSVARSFNRHIPPRNIKGVREASQGNGTRPGEGAARDGGRGRRPRYRGCRSPGQS